jgi:hypothetical protein
VLQSSEINDTFAFDNAVNMYSSIYVIYCQGKTVQYYPDDICTENCKHFAKANPEDISKQYHI